MANARFTPAPYEKSTDRPSDAILTKMDIGKRLRELREAQGLSQGDIEHRSGLARSYLSRAENGYTTPSLRSLERWADALEVDLYQLFFAGHDQPKAPELQAPMDAQDRKLWGILGQMPVEDRALVMSIARELVKRKGERK